MKNIRLKYIAKIEMGQSPPSSEYTNEVNGIPFLQGTAEFGEKYPSPTIYSLSPNKFSYKNDILFSVRAPVGQININNYEKVGIGRGLCSIRVIKGNSQQFLWWALHAVRDQLKYYETGTTYSAVSTEDIGNLLIPVYDLSNQNKIAELLNSELNKIDALITKKTQLLEILEEKRKAIINQAVTQGLNSNVPIKDTEISWLGKIPEHWELVRLKYFSDINYGLSQPPEYMDYGTPLIRATNVSSGKITPKDMVYIDGNQLNSNKKINLKKGDIIIVRSGAYTADSAIIPEEYDNSIAGFDMVIRTKNSLVDKFLSYVLLSDYMLNKQLIPMRIRAAQPHLNAEEVAGTTILLPPKEEQESIIQYLDKFLNHHEKSLGKIHKSLELLKEKRIAVISAAINGDLT